MGCSCSSSSVAYKTHSHSDFSSLGGNFSEVGKAVLAVLLTKHGVYENSLWRRSSGRVLGCVQSPPGCFFLDQLITQDMEQTHSDFLPERICDIISHAEQYVDIVTLTPPNGKFNLSIAKALKALHDKGKPITLRMLVGNVIGWGRTNGHKVLEDLTQQQEYPIPKHDTKLSLYIGSYNIGATSWNHCKIIAVDGKRLLQGGHNLWDKDYLCTNPIRDISMEAEGAVAHDGHKVANRMWEFLKNTESSTSHKRKLPDFVPILSESCCEIVSWPLDNNKPDPYDGEVPVVGPEDVAMISCGRLAAIHEEEDAQIPSTGYNPSDSALLAMICAARKSLKFSIQDVGPVCKDLPGVGLWSPLGWPTEFLAALGSAMCQRGVDVEIILSGPGCKGYGYGWTCTDVAVELVKVVRGLQGVSDEQVRVMLDLNLRMCYMRSSGGQCDWPGQACGNHAKFFIVDDKTYYMGSQNLYKCDLAEWGVIVDDKKETDRIMEAYWMPAWEASYKQNRDCNLDAIFEKLSVSSVSPNLADLSDEEREAWFLAEEAAGLGSKRTTKNLHVWVKRGKNMAAAQDVYLKVRVVNSKGETKESFRSTTCFSGSKDPVWNEQFSFMDLGDPSSMSLVINIFDQRTLSVLGLGSMWTDDLVADEKLGSAKIDLGTLSKTGDFQEQEVVIEKGSFVQSSLVLALNTANSWGRADTHSGA